eukprot:349681-Chlamydomonas_euryale.AAC.1
MIGGMIVVADSVVTPSTVTVLTNSETNGSAEPAARPDSSAACCELITTPTMLPLPSVGFW